MTPYYEDEAVQLFHGDCLALLPQMPVVDHVITDPPFSERTHAGHNKGDGRTYDGARRSAIHYEPWTEADARAIVPALCAQSRGWVVVFNDHLLTPVIQGAMHEAGRYTFAPIPWYAPGSRVRLNGDGPSSWTVWISVCRTGRQRSWGTLPGGYALTGDSVHMGGKPDVLMRAIVSDYSREGDLILDPFAGSGTTLVAAKRLGRKAIGIELNEQYCAVAAKRLASTHFEPSLLPSPNWKGKQDRLHLEGETA